MTRRHLWLLSAILLLALALRFFRLEGQSLWYDEGISVALAGRDLTTITRSAAGDIHPPLYYYLLHGWVAVFGDRPTAVRSLSAFIGVALVALTYLLGRRVFTRPVGLVAAFLAAISPFQVYYSQETRMYILAAMLGALSTYLALKVGESRYSISDIRYWVLGIGDWRFSTQYPIPNTQCLVSLSLWIAYIVTTALVLYTHYFGFTVLLAQNLAMGLWVLFRPRRRLGFAVQWAAAQIVVGLLYLPWLALTWRQLQAWPAVSQPFSLAFLLADVLRVFSLGLSIEPSITPAAWLFGLLLLLGLIGTIIRNPQSLGRVRSVPRPAIRNREGLPWLTSILYLAVPVGALYILSLRRPLYNPKFLLLATPPFHLLVALGIHGASRITHHASRITHHAIPTTQYLIPTALLLALLTLPTVRSLHNYYFDPAYARDDYRGIARTIQAMAQPNDAILLNAPGQIEIFDYYYRGTLPRYPLPRARPPDPEATTAELQDIVGRHDRIYGIFWATDESDPGRIVETWLDEHAYKAMDAWYGHVRLVLYQVPPAANEGITRVLDVRLGDRVRLLSATLATPAVRSGDVLPITLRWQALRPIERRYKVFVQLLSPAHQLIAQRDAEPGGGARLTTTWTPGETIVDRYGVWIPPGTPPADYRLLAGMYDLETGQRLPVVRAGELTAARGSAESSATSSEPLEVEAPIQAAGDFIDLGTVQVRAPRTPPLEALNVGRWIAVDYGPVRLLGYTIDKRGAEGQRGVPLHPGDTLRLTLFWQTLQQPMSDLGLTLRLQAGDQPLQEVWATPTDGLYPATRWSPGEVIRDPHDLPLPAEVSPGHYLLRLTVAQGSGSVLGQLDIPVTIQ